MSLLTDSFEELKVIAIETEDDGYGGSNTTVKDAMSFQGAITFNNSVQSYIAMKMGVSSLYTLTTSRDITLMYHAVIKRVRDGKVFRVASDGDDKYTPKMANLDMKQVSLEEWEIPNE